MHVSLNPPCPFCVDLCFHKLYIKSRKKGSQSIAWVDEMSMVSCPPCKKILSQRSFDALLLCDKCMDVLVWVKISLAHHRLNWNHAFSSPPPQQSVILSWTWLCLRNWDCNSWQFLGLQVFERRGFFYPTKLKNIWFCDAFAFSCLSLEHSVTFTLPGFQFFMCRIWIYEIFLVSLILCMRVSSDVLQTFWPRPLKIQALNLLHAGVLCVLQF